jgi:hypothetical protein
MIEIELDNWPSAGVHEPIIIQVQAVPREGDSLWIHRSLMPDSYFDPDHGTPVMTYNEPDDDWEVETRISGVMHYLRPGRHVISVGFGIVRYADGTSDLD